MSNIFKAALATAFFAAATPAIASADGFTFGGFTSGGLVTVSFFGADLNADGAWTNIPGYGAAGEITGLTVSFTGNAVIPAFTTSTFVVAEVLYTNFLGLAASVAGFPLVKIGDGLIEARGTITGPAAGDFLLIGADCAAFGGAFAAQNHGSCAGLQYAPTGGVAVTDIVSLPVPEPISATIFLTALSGLASIRRRCSPAA